MLIDKINTASRCSSSSTFVKCHECFYENDVLYLDISSFDDYVMDCILAYDLNNRVYLKTAFNSNNNAEGKMLALMTLQNKLENIEQVIIENELTVMFYPGDPTIVRNYREYRIKKFI